MRRLLVLITLLVFPGLATAETRVALVIGNSDYENVGKLVNPANDARDVGAALESSGFTVDYGFNLTLAQTLERLKIFRAKAEKADDAVIYYAGHGIEIDRKNFMIPVDAKLESSSDVEFEAVPLELTMSSAAVSDGLSLVIMDACRDNPYAAQMRRIGGTRSIGRGLGAVEPIGNTLVAYAAREGTTAADGEGRNSPYAKALAKAISTEGLEIGKLFRQVRDDVLTETGGVQEPFVYGSLSAEDWYFQPPAKTVSIEPETSQNREWSEVFRRSEVVHVGDDQRTEWPVPRPVGRCYRTALDFDGPAEKIRVIFEPYGVEDVAVVFSGKRKIVRQAVRDGEHKPDYWGPKIKVDIPVNAEIKRGDRVAICARRLKDGEKAGDRDDFMLRRLVIKVATR